MRMDEINNKQQPVQDTGRVEVPRQAEVELAEIRLKEMREKAQIEMDKAKADADNLNGSWSDELIIVVVFFPIIVTFAEVFVNDAVSAKDAWANINSMSDNYFTLIMVITLIVFGMRSLVTKIIDKWIGKK